MKPHTLSLESVLDEPLRVEAELPVSVPAIDREPLLALSPLRLAGELSRIDGGYALEARLAYEGQLECSRCLAPYPFQEDEAFTLVLTPRPVPSGAAASKEVELAPADLDTQYYDPSQPIVELLPIAEERVQMALPMKPLCRPDCRGLCPTCGKDLNLGACACKRDTVDPRWDALRGLREKV
ncbi:MAG TPA: DUF177 domain-containing protein [Thermoanaerobaculia bacterium]